MGEIDLLSWLIPSDCIVGSGLTRILMLKTLSPLTFTVALPALGGLVGVSRRYLSRRSGSTRSDRLTTAPSTQSSWRAAAVEGVFRWIPFSLVAAFCFTPYMSTTSFHAWHCLSFTYDAHTNHAFLARDLSVRCDGSHEHEQILSVAWFLVATWPIGMVLFYALILIPCRSLLYNEAADSRIIRATSFLHRDYKHT